MKIKYSSQSGCDGCDVELTDGALCLFPLVDQPDRV